MTRNEHLLTIAAEEAVEVAQRCTKALRFGEDEVQPDSAANPDHLTNRMRIMREFADLIAALQMFGFCVQAGSLQPWVDEKRAKVERFLAYSKECGTLDEEAKART